MEANGVTYQKRVLYVHEFCELYGVARSTLQKMWKDNRGPTRKKCGKRVIIRIEDAESWLAGMGA